MAGLPKSYIKKYGISARAWREYRKTKRKKPTAKKKTTTKKRGGKTVAKRKAPARRRPAAKRKAAPKTRAVVRRARSAVRRVTTGTRRRTKTMMTATTRAAVKTGIGIAGAAGSAAIVNTLPLSGPAKAWSQLAIGLGLIALSPKRAVNLKIAGSGAALVAALAVLKTSGIPIPQLMAGTGQMGLNYRPGMGRYPRGKRLATQYAPKIPAPAPAPSQMGINYQIAGNGGSSAGYGPKFRTQADM